MNEFRTDVILPSLFADYRAVSEELNECVQQITAIRQSLLELYRALKEAELTYKVAEAAILYAETSKDGRISGSNETARKHQTMMLLTEEQQPGGRLYDSYRVYRDLDESVQRLNQELQSYIDRMSAARNRARMIAGLAYALHC